MATLLHRTGSKGQFVLYPADFSPQWRDPVNRRYQTKCDMLVGPCACGRRHCADDEDVMDNLECRDCKIETLEEWRLRQ